MLQVPCADNAGENAEMSGLGEEVQQGDTLDSLGSHNGGYRKGLLSLTGLAFAGFLPGRDSYRVDSYRRDGARICRWYIGLD